MGRKKGTSRKFCPIVSRATPHLRKSLMKLFVRTSAFFAAVLIATGTIAGVGQANAQTNPLESQIRALLDANPEIVVNALNKNQEIGRTTCREGGCQDVKIAVVTVKLKKKKKKR